MLCGAKVSRSSSQRYLPNAGCPFARTGTRRHRWSAPQRDALEEGGHRLVPPVPGGQRRHGHRPVRGQHRDDGVDVGALPGVDEALDDLAQALVVQRAEQRLLAALGKPLVHRLVGALQRAVDPGRRRLERLGDLARREAEHVAEDEHGALTRRQVLERRDEGELDALALLVPRLRAGEPFLEAERSHPDRAAPRRSRPGARPGRRGGRRRGRSRSGAPAWAGARARGGRRSSRSHGARSGASFAPRTGAARARRSAARPGARPRRRAPSPASGSSGRAGRRGGPPPAARRRPRRPRGPPPGAGPRSRGAPHRRAPALGLPEGDLAA